MKTIFVSRNGNPNLRERTGQLVELPEPRVPVNMDPSGGAEMLMPIFNAIFPDGLMASVMLNELPDWRSQLLNEVVFDITSYISRVVTPEQIQACDEWKDSRDMAYDIHKWALNFEKSPDNWGEDYLERVEEYARLIVDYMIYR